MFSFVKGSGWGVTTLPNRFDWEMEGSKVVMSWPQAAEYNMITNKQIGVVYAICSATDKPDMYHPKQSHADNDPGRRHQY